jgi:hypothetical protein
MRSPFYFIVSPNKGKRYNNTKEISGVDIITSTSEEDFRFANREAIVKELPLGYTGPIKKGDTLLVHHNVFKFYNDIKGRRKSGKSFFKDDLFFIEPDQFFMYHNGTQWNAYDRYCFVEPIPVQKSYIYKNIKEEPLMGLVKYPNEYLISKGINEGDMVCFKPESEYEFEVDGKKMYRMFDHSITMKL